MVLLTTDAAREKSSRSVESADTAKYTEFRTERENNDMSFRHSAHRAFRIASVINNVL